MKNLFCQVEGHVVRQVLFDDESVTLGFDAYSIVVYNAYHFTDCEAIGLIPSSTVVQVRPSDTDVLFLFSSGCILTVHLDDDSYAGPEALVLYDTKSGRATVWN